MKYFLTIAAAFLSTTWYAQALIIVNVTDNGADTTFSYSGTFNLTGATLPNPSFLNQANTEGGMRATTGRLYSSATSGFRDLWDVGTAVTPFGTDANNYFTFGGLAPVLHTGDTFGFLRHSSSITRVVLPGNYVSNSFIAGTITIEGTTMASIGFTPITYNFSNGESIALQTGAPAAVPEPATSLPLLGLIAGFAWMRRRKKGQK